MTTCLSLEFFYFDAGGGHRSAALALQKVIADQYSGWRVVLVNLQELLQPIDPIFRFTRIRSQTVYNKYLATGMTYGSAAFLRGLQKGIQHYGPEMEASLAQHWRQSRPDMVVSLIPNFNGVMFRALRRVSNDIPYVTIMTDLADSPPHFWHEAQDQFMICGTEHAYRQAQATGYRDACIFQTSGMILKPVFYEARQIDRRAERVKLKLDPDLPTALIMFGGYGSKISAGIVERLNEAELPVQSIVLCGHNETLRLALQDKPHCHAVGFSDDVAFYMSLADFFIGKPGPGSISEAIHMGLPVIVENNKRTLLQERYNAEWIAQQGVGVAITSYRKIAEAVRRMIAPGVLEQMRRKAQSLDNQAVYEIPALLRQIMAEKASSRIVA